MAQKNGGLLRRASYAMKGLATAWRSERAFRDQAIASVVLLALTAVVGPGALWWALVVLAICGSLALELLNAGLESVCDRLHPEMHPMIGAAKDLASAAVFTMNVGLKLVFVLMLATHLL
ncbi:diacylglycerol kinase [Croceicoccus sp. BE223]|uniref:diacylglycerol kinase n=1 Tax=Croceicoccus sp. BE223 TaxID=2817716 RepID=UPI00286097BB|nr:diacylglycerol kinase [Croceicoccus sp. BE223]MDR7102005.1 diacylglycerol kinase (ATP) [Croceicoccus sp. BE223]